MNDITVSHERVVLVHGDVVDGGLLAALDCCAAHLLPPQSILVHRVAVAPSETDTELTMDVDDATVSHADPSVVANTENVGGS